MQVVFRADASTVIGSGHVMRCMTLAHALKRRGAEVLFVCRAADGDMKPWLEQQGVAVAWLCGAPEKDWEETLTALASHAMTAPDWVVLDHYGLGQEWEQAVRRSGPRVFVIDDLADRPHDCDLLLDQNLVADYDTRYGNLVPKAAVALLGPRYAMLQAGYRAAHQAVAPRIGKPHRILVSFGAADLPDMTTKVVQALLRRADDIFIDVIVGASNPKRDSLVELAAANPRLAAYVQLPSLVEAMARADLAIGAGGATSWERICLGLPALVITLADNQRPIAEETQRRGFAIWLGDSEALDEAELELALEHALSQDVRDWFNTRGAQIIDGRGVDRVVEAMVGDIHEVLVCRPVTEKDEDLLLGWANDPTTRATAFSPNPITREQHHTWFMRRLSDAGAFRLFIVETAGGVELGQVRFEREDTSWIISYSLAREYRGRGLAAKVLEAGLNALRNAIGSADTIGRVRPDNIASQRVFQRLRFTMTHVDDKTVEFGHRL